MPSKNILNGGRNKQILLLQPQLLASLGRVIGVEHTCNVLCSLPRLECIIILTTIECKEVEFVERH